MVRAGERNSASQQFYANRIIAIGRYGDADFLNGTPDEIRAALYKQHPQINASTISSWTRQDILFRDKANIGDIVLTYDKPQRLYLAGLITSLPKVDRSLFRDERPWGIVRDVNWTMQVLRDDLSSAALAGLDRRSTIHAIPPKAIEELSHRLVPLQ